MQDGCSQIHTREHNTIKILDPDAAYVALSLDQEDADAAARALVENDIENVCIFGPNIMIAQIDPTKAYLVQASETAEGLEEFKQFWAQLQQEGKAGRLYLSVGENIEAIETLEPITFEFPFIGGGEVNPPEEESEE